MFDEFEKVYEQKQQEAILTLLDGVFPSKKLFILTCNDKWKVDSHMRNRPGRIFYMLDFKGLSVEFIKEYCQDNLINNKSYIDQICNVSSLFGQFNFDMLKALVEEINRYDEPPAKALEILNIKPEFDQNKASYNVQLFIDEKEVHQDRINTKIWVGNPVMSDIDNCIKVWEVEDEDNKTHPEDNDLTVASPTAITGRGWNWKETNFTSAHLVKIDAKIGKYKYINDEKVVMILTKKEESRPNYFNAF